jgi:glycosyltransferase involved in cell wall biosynthesis
MTTPLGVDAIEIGMTGKVIADGFRDRLPCFDRILNLPDLFSLATRYFRRHGRFLRVRMPQPPQIMHWTYPIPVRLEGAKNIYTLHDLVPLRLPYTTLDHKPFYQRLISGCLRHGDHLCTVSEASLRDVVSLFPEAAGRIVNTYESFDPPKSALLASDTDVAAQLHGLFDLPYRGYFLFFGSLEPKKNIGRLVEAYLSSGLSTPLVLVGAQAWKSEQELRLVKLRQGRPRRDGEPTVIQIEYVPLPMLMTLIRGAKAVTFPSLYEGFGLPVLEAMALGTPVLTSNGGSLPEIAGEAAVIVDPYDVGAMAAGLQRLDADEALRNQLRHNGPVQAAKFSMAAFQEKMAMLYEIVLPSRV